jgi:hypothetical protein
MSALFVYLIPEYESLLVNDQPEAFYISATLGRKYTIMYEVGKKYERPVDFVFYWVKVRNYNNEQINSCGETNYGANKKVTLYYFRHTWFYIPYQFYTYECKT